VDDWVAHETAGTRKQGGKKATHPVRLLVSIRAAWLLATSVLHVLCERKHGLAGARGVRRVRVRA